MEGGTRERESESVDKMPVGCLSAGRHVDSTLYIREEAEQSQDKSQVFYLFLCIMLTFYSELETMQNRVSKRVRYDICFSVSC